MFPKSEPASIVQEGDLLLLLLAGDGGGEGCRDLASQLLILGPCGTIDVIVNYQNHNNIIIMESPSCHCCCFHSQKRHKRLINLGLVVLVDPWQGEDPDPGEGDQGQAGHQGAQVAHQVHAHCKLKRGEVELPNYLHLGGLDDVLNEDDGLECSKQSVDSSTRVLQSRGQLRLGDPDVNVQECLPGKV